MSGQFVFVLFFFFLELSQRDVGSGGGGVLSLCIEMTRWISFVQHWLLPCILHTKSVLLEVARSDCLGASMALECSSDPGELGLGRPTLGGPVSRVGPRQRP